MRTSLAVSLLALIVGCGGSTESDPAGTAPTTTEGQLRAPAAVGSLPTAPSMAPLHFYVSNQSFDLDPVDIDVYVDDVKLIAGDFEVKGQHNWIGFDFNAEANKSHTVRAVTTKGHVEETKVVEVPSAGRWVVVLL